MVVRSSPMRWSLRDLLPGGMPDLETILAELETCAQKIEACRENLRADMPVTDFIDLLHIKERLVELSNVSSAFAYLRYSENTQDPDAISLQDRIDQTLSEIDNRVLFFNLWFKGLPEEATRRFIQSAGDLSYYLESILLFKPYTLSEPEEKIIKIKDLNGAEGLVKIYEILTNGLKFKIEVDGVQKTLTKDGLTQYYRHPSPDLRAQTYRELYRVYGENKNVLAQIYIYLARDFQAECVGLRGYTSPIAVRNLNNDLPDPVVETLLAVCRHNSALYQRYFRLKARLLGMERLRRYDIYAPVSSVEKKVDLESGIRLVLDSFQQFSPQLAQAASLVLEHNHLDTEVRPCKRGGAFSYSVTPRLVPWVMVNYTERLRDVSTLAHELGHAAHTIFAADHSVLSFHPPQPLAETASVFAEMLLSDRMLSEELDPAVKQGMLMAILDDAYATVQRQAFISIFERDAYEKIAAGCSSEDLAQLYIANLTEQFGEAVALSDEFAWEWITIPHIYNSPFYPYAYSFGQLLVLALYQQYLQDRQAFLPRYLKLLAYGGSARPADILAEAGLDITSPSFWQGGFDVLYNKLEQLEQITGGIS